MRRGARMERIGWRVNERELKAAASIPAVAFKNPNPCVKINVSRCGLATNRSDNVAPPPHPPALAAHLKIHVHLCAESKVPIYQTQLSRVQCDEVGPPLLTDFHALPTTLRARRRSLAASRGRDISRKRLKKN